MVRDGGYQSRLEPREFQDWVLRTVPPAIRRDGAYIMREEKVASGGMGEDEIDLTYVAAALPLTLVRLRYGRRNALASNFSRNRRMHHYSLRHYGCALFNPYDPAQHLLDLIY